MNGYKWYGEEDGEEDLFFVFGDVVFKRGEVQCFEEGDYKYGNYDVDVDFVEGRIFDVRLVIRGSFLSCFCIINDEQDNGDEYSQFY